MRHGVECAGEFDINCSSLVRKISEQLGSTNFAASFRPATTLGLMDWAASVVTELQCVQLAVGLDAIYSYTSLPHTQYNPAFLIPFVLEPVCCHTAPFSGPLVPLQPDDVRQSA